MKKFFKTHKKKCIIGICVFFAIILIFFTIYFILPSFENNSYGSRLDEIDSYKISTSKINDIKSTIKEEDGVTNITYHREGRILNFIITFEEGYNIDSAKTCASKVIDKISKRNLKYYDVQIFIKSSNTFTTIGYHAKGKKKLKWAYRGDESES